MSELQVYDTPEGIARYSLESMIVYCRMRGHGIQFPSNHPKLRQLKKAYGLKAKTFSEASEEITTELSRLIPILAAKISSSRGVSADGRVRVDSPSPVE